MVAKRRAFLAAGLASTCSRFLQAEPAATPIVGRLEQLDIRSRFVDARPVTVWLPASYDGRKPHAVLYMQDGQMLYSRSLNMDAVAPALLASGVLRDFIVVAPWNNGQLRQAEYYPKGFLDHLFPEDLRGGLVQDDMHGRPLSDAYLRYLVDELKPAVDARYATRPERESNCLFGCSLGALVSLYALCEYPRVFGGAACLSTHLIGTYQPNEHFESAALAYLKVEAPDPARVRLYMDRGDQDLDAHYVRAQSNVDALLHRQGFQSPGFVSRVYAGAGHNEASWQRRLEEPLRFLFGV